MNDDEANLILSRVGRVLVVVGVIDIAVMIYCMVTAQAYSSSLNVFAVVAGAFLIKGSLRTASIVRFFAAFLLSAMTCLLITGAFLQPLGLTWAYMRQSPLATLIQGGLMLMFLWLTWWVLRQLDCPTLKLACQAANVKMRSLKWPVLVGMVLVLGVGVLFPLLTDGGAGRRAKAVAAERVGSGYSLHVSALRWVKSDKGTSVSAVVTAWNHREIKEIPVQWQEP